MSIFNGIYLTEKGKKEIECKLEEVENAYLNIKGNNSSDEHYLAGARIYLKEILFSAKILPQVNNSFKGIDLHNLQDEFSK